MKQKLFTLLLAIMASVGIMFAERVKIGELYFNLDMTNQTAEVTYDKFHSSTSYSGLTTVSIPSSVEYNNITYNVTTIGNDAFCYCSLMSVTIPNSVTRIGHRAFYSCRLTKITIPDSVTTIGAETFYCCNSLTSAMIGNGVTSIGSNAFYGCSNLTEVIIGASVTSIGDEAFRNCSNLTSIEIPNSVTSIGEKAFYNCRGLTSITIGNSVANIGSDAFEACHHLLSVHINDIAAWCLINFSNITANPLCVNLYEAEHLYINGNEVIDLVIPNNVTSIGNYAFYRCSNVTSITFPKSVTTIGNKAFYGCHITSITIPNRVLSMGEGVFEECDNLTNVIWNAENCTSASIDYKSPFYRNGNIKSFIIGENVKTIPAYLCYSMNNLDSLIIPDSVTSIGNSAFYYCTGLTSVTIPNSVTSIEDYAFRGCSGLTSVHISDVAAWCNISFGGIYANPLYYAHSLYLNGELVTDLVIPGNVTNIGDYVFSGCYDITNIYIPSSMIRIGNSAFSYCDSLTDVVWNARNCNLYNFGSQVESFIFGNDVEVIPDSLCMGMSGLTSIIIPDNVTTIGKYAFADCSSLHNLTIGRNVRTIGDEGDKTFYNCTSIDTVFWNAVRCNDMEYSPFYYSRNHIKSFTLADDIERIPSNLCWGITSITDMSIPSSVNHIGKDAFYGTNLTEVHIPNSVEEVGIRAFANCPLQKVHWGVANQADYEEEEFHSTGITVGLDASNLNWSNVYVYAWSSTGSTITSAWPGTKVSTNANGIYTFTFPSSYSKVNIIWNNGTDQTVDITNITSSAIYSLTSSSGKNITYTTRQFTGTPLSPFINSTANLTEFTFGENVKRVPALLCEDMNALTEVIIPQNVEYLGKNAFKGCSNLATLSLGENITTYGENVFAGCPALTSIYNYRDHPAKLGTDAFKDVDYFNCTLYVLAGSVNMYKAAGSDWKDFYYIKPIGTTETTVTEDKVTVSPADNSALFTWRTSDDASTYTLQITQDGVVFCTLVFDADGLLKGIAFASGKDGHAHTPAATLTANGMQFTVTGLSSASKYAYRLAVADSQNNEIIAYSGEFATNGYEGEVNPGGNPEGIDEVPSDQVQSTKILREGQIFILRGDKTYTLQGQEVK